MNIREIHETARSHFKKHYWNVQAESSFIGKPKRLAKPITDEEVTKAVEEQNNRAVNSDKLLANLLKYAPQEVHEFIQEILDGVSKNNQHLSLEHLSHYRNQKNQKAARKKLLTCC